MGRSYSEDMQTWMQQARARRGKAIWNDAFLKEEAPFKIGIDSNLSSGDVSLPTNERLSREATDDLHYARFVSHSMKIYPEGVITYSICYRLVHKVSTSIDAENSQPPLSTPRAIAILDGLEDVSWLSFKQLVQDWLRGNTVAEGLCKAFSVESEFDCTELQMNDFKRRSRTHKLLVLEAVLRPAIDGEHSDSGFDGWCRVSPEDALLDPSVAGLLNTATWYKEYRPKYLIGLAEKNIGYRIDEIYLTDRKASLVSNAGFWHQDNPLQEYRKDICIVIEYWLAKLVQAHALLRFLQEHRTIREISNVTPSEALDPVVVSKRAVARLRESLDPSRLIDHGFTTAFMMRMRTEMELDTLLRFIDERVDDAATNIALRSAVTAEGVVAQKSLKIGYWTLVFTIIVLIVTLIGVAVNPFVT
ncbi:hypothetical protein EF294_03660 [Gordonia oryzae]|uniref:Uncharacterized protein n=2 Tax=Gordonia oryzae TaxID=2487349 RepID=A0A3N4GYQ4_9ACTN|nr:hypothetical protein EF294_03660 [Gordonia oryzae]